MTDQPGSAEQADPNEAIWNEVAAERAGKTQSPDDQPPAPAAADEKAETAPAEQAAEDPWANHPDLHALYTTAISEREEARKRASGQGRKVNELQRQLRTAAEAKPADTPVFDASEIDAALEDLRDYPEIEGFGSKLARGLKALDARVSTAEAVTTAAVEHDAGEEAAKLEDAHPGWLGALKDNWDTFQAFLADDDQPAWVARAYEANRNYITDAAIGARMIARFKEHLGQSARPQSDPDPSGQSDTTRNDDMRARRLAGSVSPKPRGPGVAPNPGPAQDDLEGIWKEEVARRMAKSR